MKLTRRKLASALVSATAMAAQQPQPAAPQVAVPDSDLKTARDRLQANAAALASARVTEPSLGAWHSIRVVALGPKIQAYLNGTLLLDHSDKTFTDGWLGLWTKADSVTEFADLEVAGTVVK